MSCIRSDNGMTDVGRENLEATALRFAEGRLRLERLVGRHPEIRNVELRPPIIVTGIPRSGTTELVTALAEHPALQSLRYRDAAHPFASDARANGRDADALDQAIPGIHRLHDMAPGAQADDAELMGLSFSGYAFEWLCHAPKWRDRYLAEDQSAAYRYLKLSLQALAYLRRDDRRWVIKNPQHVEQLPALKAVFPDALLVVSGRDQGARLRSMARVMDALVPALRTTAIPMGYWRSRFAAMERRYVEARQLFPDRIELTGWVPSEAQAVVWEAANLQPMRAAAY